MIVKPRGLHLSRHAETMRMGLPELHAAGSKLETSESRADRHAVLHCMAAGRCCRESGVLPTALVCMTTQLEEWISQVTGAAI